MKKIISFGDSFIFGTEIKDNRDGSKGWPGVAASHLGHEFECRAVPGCGNTHILKQILDYYSTNSMKDTLAVINWTWAMRWDVLDLTDSTNITLGPTCVPEKLQKSLDSESAQNLLNFFQKFVSINPNQYLAESLRSIYVAQRFLTENSIPNIQTYMDHSMLKENQSGSLLDFYSEIRIPSWPMIHTSEQWHDLTDSIQQEVLARYDEMAVPNWIKTLQLQVSANLQNFDGMNFLEWSRHNGYDVTPEPGLHPLDQAHQEAALLWKDRYDQALA
jgi:hypothetical protein